MRLNIDKIIKDDNPLIRKKSKEVKLPLNKTDEALLKAMHKYVVDSTDEEKSEKYNLRPAVGIAAVQCGALKRMIAIVIPEEDGTDTEYALVNPKIVSQSVQNAYLKYGEGCLSVEEFHEGEVLRSARITVKGYDYLTKQEVQIRARGYLAIVLQHELDHFEGILYYDHIKKFIPPHLIEQAIAIE